MRRILLILLSIIAQPAAAQEPPNRPETITSGSQDVLIGGRPAARQGDTTTSGHVVVEGSKNVFFNGKPAVVLGGKTDCGGAVVTGQSHVFVNGKPLATEGDLAAGCPGK